MATTFTPNVTRSIGNRDRRSVCIAHAHGTSGTEFMRSSIDLKEKVKLSLKFFASQSVNGKVQTHVNGLIQQNVTLDPLVPSIGC
jgi:hypothetical protein